MNPSLYVKSLMLCGVLSAFTAGPSVLKAEEALEPMAGTGGVMRDAERRAVTPAAARKPAAAPNIKTGKTDEDPRLKAVAKKELGPISMVRFYGAAEFAHKEDIGSLIMAALDADGESGKSKTVGQVTRALASARKELMSRGYYLVRLSLARKNTYDPDTHVLSVLVDEGRFGKLNIKFDDESDDGTWYSKRQILRRFRNIKEGECFDYNRLRTALFDANSHPDLTIDTAIDVRKPIEGEGNDRRVARYADLDLTVRERFPLHAVFEVNNYGMEDVEEWQASLTLQYLNVTKHDDTFTISPAISFGGELKSVAGSYMLPHSWWLGGNSTLYGGWSDLDVDNIVPRLDLEGTGWFFGLQHSEYLYDDDRHLVALSFGALWRYIEDQYTALQYKLNKREVSIMPLSLALSYTGKKPDFLGGRNFGTMQGVYNIASSGDDLEEMWTDAEENYWILRAQLARLQPLFGWYDDKTEKELHQWMLFLKLEAQYTTDTLIPIEKLSMGGYNCMRGYRTRGYIGDYGGYGTLELRTPILVDTFSALVSDRTAKTPIDRLQFLGFVDYGWIAFNDLPASYGDDSEFIFSAGLGARLSVTKYTQFKCDVAFPLRDTDWADDDSMEFYVSVQVQF